MGAARCLCSGRRPERSAWLGSYFRVPFTSVRCADVPPTAREAGPSWPWSWPPEARVPLSGSDGAESRWAASRRCRGFAQRCGWPRSFDPARSDLCSRHQQGSCGRYACGSVLPAVQHVQPRPSLRKISSPIVHWTKRNATIKYQNFRRRRIYFHSQKPVGESAVRRPEKAADRIPESSRGSGRLFFGWAVRGSSSGPVRCSGAVLLRAGGKRGCLLSGRAHSGQTKARYRF
eukprot:COSAG06_NODE_2110_length_7564_cov_5.889350_2_plen_232_part_00